MKTFITAVLILCVAALGSCKRSAGGSAPGDGTDTSAAAAAATGKDVRLLTVGELRDILERGEAVLVDVRTEEQYREGHIKGAVSLPKDQLSTRVRELPEGRLLVSYCACPAEHLSIAAALEMRQLGRQNVAVLAGGLRAWLREKLPSESAHAQIFKPQNAAKN
jgi:rhodanese-related sulfurtransferase